MKFLVVLCSFGMFLLPITPVFAADWPQYHGPTRNCLVPDSPPLLEEFPKDGLKKVWASEVLPDPEYQIRSYVEAGELVVADGRLFTYLQDIHKPTQRKISALAFESEGYNPNMAPELSKLVEEARVSEARLKLKDRKEIDAWAEEWAKANVTRVQSRWRQAAVNRLSSGSVLSWDVLGKLAANMDHVWDTDKEAQDWMNKEGIDEPSQKYIQAASWWNWKGLGFTGTGKEAIRDVPAEDFICCFDAQNGKLLWKTAPMKGLTQSMGAHTTPAVQGDRCYVFNSRGEHHCFDVKTGQELWHSEAFVDVESTKVGHQHSRCSSVLLVDGVAIGLADVTAGVDMETGKTLWCRKDVGFHEAHSSPVIWRDGQKNWVIVHYAGKLYCLDPKDGTTRWEWTDKWFKGATGTPAIVGDTLVLATGASGFGGSDTDVAAFKLTPEKPEVLWHLPLIDEYATPLIDHGYVYFLSGGTGTSTKNGKATCIELASGKVLWEETKVFEHHVYTSPVLADGKIIAINEGGLTIFKATPDAFTLIGRQDKLGIMIYITPTIVDGRVYLRLANKRQIACYDLRKP